MGRKMPFPDGQLALFHPSENRRKHGPQEIVCLRSCGVYSPIVFHEIFPFGISIYQPNIISIHKYSTCNFRNSLEL